MCSQRIDKLLTAGKGWQSLEEKYIGKGNTNEKVGGIWEMSTN